MKPTDSGSTRIRHSSPTPDHPCLERVRFNRLLFRPIRGRRKNVIAAGRARNRLRINLTPELSWQTSDYRVEIKRRAHPR